MSYFLDTFNLKNETRFVKADRNHVTEVFWSIDKTCQRLVLHTQRMQYPFGTGKKKNNLTIRLLISVLVERDTESDTRLWDTHFKRSDSSLHRFVFWNFFFLSFFFYIYIITYFVACPYVLWLIRLSNIFELLV